MGINLKDLKLRACINKANGQLNLSLSKKDMPRSLKESIDKEPSAVKYLLMQFRGFES